MLKLIKEDFLRVISFKPLFAPRKANGRITVNKKSQIVLI
ncbi:MAG: hypothetical protein JWQ40_578 [Segetibacter sp.]|nr:hypothetical protein [Segetibacter sp.]